jgi:hypothetical protein
MGRQGSKARFRTAVRSPPLRPFDLRYRAVGGLGQKISATNCWSLAAMFDSIAVPRRLILAFLFVAISLGRISPGYACSFKHATEQELFSQASSIFVAHLTSVSEIPLPDNVKGIYKGIYDKILEGSFQTIELIKGEPPASGKVRSAPFENGNCTIPFLVGADYIFFLRKEDDYIMFVTGSAGPVMDLKGTDVRKRLEGLRAMAK